jgi:hypothetical protein
LKKKIADNIYSSVDVDDELKDTKQAQAVFSTLAMYTQLQHVILSVGDLSDHNKESISLAFKAYYSFYVWSVDVNHAQEHVF